LREWFWKTNNSHGKDAAVNDLNGWGLDGATDEQRRQEAEWLVDAVLNRVRQPLIDAVADFFKQPLSPLGLMLFEVALLGLVREMGRQLLEALLNTCEPDRPDSLPKDLWFENGGYRRRNQKTANRNVTSRFGDIVLHRHGYRSWQAGDGSLFPLEMLLGLNHSATPALVDWIGRHIAAAGSNQAAVIELLRAECGATMGVKRLRQCVEQLSESMEVFRQEHQVDVLLEGLRQAVNSSGSRKPVIAVGRDGITLREYKHKAFKVATAATVSVYDRRGKRLITVYLAHPPELGQATMDQMLTDLITELLERWNGPLPRLAYVTDSGSNETGYFENVLRRMVHPRTRQRLEWTRVADYYHASERIWTMADVLFGKGTKEAHGWAKRTLKALKKSSGASRVLHSAASHFHRRQRKPRQLSKKKEETFWTAYRYIQSRTQFMRYSDYAALHIPLGSGVTEAACKTVFTQRLKNSGMRWTHDGAKMILTLRTILLSKSWSSTYATCLATAYPHELRPYGKNIHKHHTTAV
jgi:hypothetical protein